MSNRENCLFGECKVDTHSFNSELGVVKRLQSTRGDIVGRMQGLENTSQLYSAYQEALNGYNEDIARARKKCSKLLENACPQCPLRNRA